MSENNIERNYGGTVSKETYEWGLRIHQYIPQSDQGIVDEIEMTAEGRKKPLRVLDLGCGPGRLTSRFANVPSTKVVGLDNSPEFIDSARREGVSKNLQYIQSDFLAYNPEQLFDVIVMQGVFHHVHGAERAKWIKRLSEILSPAGTLIVGDEFIPEYEKNNEDERKARAGLFYLHIIGEALKGRAKKGEMDLAKEECINFIADVLSGEDICGYYDDVVIEYIQQQAVALNARLFLIDDIPNKEKLDGASVALKTNEVIQWVRSRARALKESGAEKRIDRGDYKVSIAVLEEEYASAFVADKNRERQFGPVGSIGGMSVLVFEKKKIQ